MNHPTNTAAPSGDPSTGHRVWMRVAASVREAEVPRLANLAAQQGWTVQRTTFDDATGDIELACSAGWGLDEALPLLDAMATAVDAAATAGGVIELTVAHLDEHGMPWSQVRFTGPDEQSLEYAQMRYGLNQARQHLESVLGQAGATHVLAQATRMANDLHRARLSVMPTQTPKSLRVARSRA